MCSGLQPRRRPVRPRHPPSQPRAGGVGSRRWRGDTVAYSPPLGAAPGPIFLVVQSHVAQPGPHQSYKIGPPGAWIWMGREGRKNRAPAWRHRGWSGAGQPAAWSAGTPRPNGARMLGQVPWCLQTRGPAGAGEPRVLGPEPVPPGPVDPAGTLHPGLGSVVLARGEHEAPHGSPSPGLFGSAVQEAGGWAELQRRGPASSAPDGCPRARARRIPGGPGAREVGRKSQSYRGRTGVENAESPPRGTTVCSLIHSHLQAFGTPARRGLTVPTESSDPRETARLREGPAYAEGEVRACPDRQGKGLQGHRA